MSVTTSSVHANGSRSGKSVVVVAILVVLSLVVLVSPAAAAKGGNGGGGGGKGGGGKGGNLPTAVVSLGDSFISGEAGRWNGNSNDGLDPDRDGTDRAYRAGWLGTWWYDYDAVYPGSYDNGCHRSDVAEIHSAAIALDAAINLACSGASTANVFRSSNGGVGHKGEAPQADQLAAVAKDYDIELVVLSIGGNDLGFTDVITACVSSFSIGGPPCHGSQQAGVDAKMASVMADVAKAIDEIEAALSSARQKPGSYRLILQSYPSPMPRASEIRYVEGNWDRLTIGGCPLWNVDADWARDSLVPQIDANLQAVATAAGVEFLSLRDAFQGREICSTSSSLVNGDSDTPSSATHEWMRFLVSGAIQGDLQESIHPNAFGQQALGRCLALAWASAGHNACTNVAGADAGQMVLSSL
jgi:lysophospholipase L1-like esterase